jgi:hypothetical protein
MSTQNLTRCTRVALAVLATAFLAAPVAAKIPPPVLDDAGKLKAAETAAKTAHTGKVANYQLCKSMDRVAVAYFGQAKKDGKAVKPADASAGACADPGVFVFTPPAPPAAPAAPGAPAAAAPAAPALAAAPPAPKK